jgi:phosphate starvation-inducible protein PhoH
MVDSSHPIDRLWLSAELNQKAATLKELYCHTTTLHLSSGHIAALLRSKAENLKRVQQEHGVFVSVERGGTDAKIVGAMEACTAAAAAIQELHHELLQSFTREQLSALFHAKAQLLKRVRQKHGVSISVDDGWRDLEASDILIGGGTAEACGSAAATLQELCHTTTLSSLSSGHIAALLRSKAETLKRVQQEYGVFVSIERGGTDAKIVGTAEACVAAAAAVHELHHETTIYVSLEHVSSVIGKRGSTIKRIQSDYGVRIQMDSNEIVVGGEDWDCIQAACDEIHSVEAQAEEWEEEKRRRQEEWENKQEQHRENQREWEEKQEAHRERQRDWASSSSSRSSASHSSISRSSVSAAPKKVITKRLTPDVWGMVRGASGCKSLTLIKTGGKSRRVDRRTGLTVYRHEEQGPSLSQLEALGCLPGGNMY